MAGHLDKAAMRLLADTPPSPTEHRCASCNRRCRPCSEGEACARAEWCTFCTNVYAKNRPAADGRVYCGGPDDDAPAAEHGCGRYLPDLATLVERGLSEYPLYCGECRDRLAGPVEQAPEPPQERPVRPAPGPEGGPASVPRVRGRGAKAEPPRQPPADPEAEALARHLTGGFRPRTAAPPAPAERSNVSEWGQGETAHPLDAARAAFGDGWGR